MRSEIDWVIHYCANGVKCDCCDKFVTNYLPMMCNMHTHGLEKYRHPNFQIVLDFPMEISGRILNALGMSVKHGEVYKAGETVGFPDGLVVKLAEFQEEDRKVLRIWFPDKHGFYPDDLDCSEAMKIQMLATDKLTYGGDAHDAD